MKKTVLFLVCSLAFSVSMLAQELVRKPFVLGETVTIESVVLQQSRTINIYLPLGYSPDSSKAYPVIYLLDGSVDEDFIHVSGLIQFLSFPWINILPECVVVGIANTDREHDFTFPTSIEQHKTDYPTTGHSGLFMNFIEKDLVPFVDSHYKVTSERTLIGQSLGGLLATEILLKKTDLFDTYFIVSPSLWWDNMSLLKYAENLDLAGKSIYIAVGDEGKQMVGPAKELYKKLKKNGGSDLRIYYQYFKDKNHGDVLHQALYDGFEKLRVYEY